MNLMLITLKKRASSVFEYGDGHMCPNCDGYYIDYDEEVCQICGWPFNQ